ncbi:MAG: D-tyrosyl-tRNA(Tyr) deacylase [Chloroflexi bacterium]|nr:D-tyrosyl-tRNA(Tyr) deacylase [Chloroflexota bacterium]
MRLLLQRVSEASVAVRGEELARIGPGLVALVGVERGDGEADVEYLAQKTVSLRLFADEGGHFNRSLLDTGGELLIVSQFTLLADVGKGRRPSFDRAAPPEEAQPLIERYVELVRQRKVSVGTGRFGETMQVEIHNQGPVTIFLDSRQKEV